VPQDIEEQIPMKAGRKGKLLEVIWTENLCSTFEASVKILLYLPSPLTLKKRSILPGRVFVVFV